MDTLPMEGAAITGTWINPKTGRVAHVRNLINDGASAIILTQEGFQIDGADFSNNWKQISDKNEDVSDIVNQMEGRSIERPVEDFVIPSQRNKSNTHTDQPKQQPVSEVILEKIFKTADLNVSVSVSGLETIKEPLTTAINFLDISIKDIANYIVSKISLDSRAIERQIQEIINPISD